MRTLLAIALSLSSCTAAPDADATMPRTQACQEQADAWCGRNGFTHESDGCHLWYVSQECQAHPSTDTVLVSAQDACLDAIADSATPSVEPEACRRTWE